MADAGTRFPTLASLWTVRPRLSSLSRRLLFALVSNAFEGIEYEYGFHRVCGWIQ
jgi:hypothetical protein